jgi:C_GCAxxG_C_C family probable redox protein
MVKQYYWQDDLNCATTSLRILSEIFSIDLEQQLLDAAVGMHGAGEYGAQCGLVEGALMFLGIYGRKNRMSDTAIVQHCRQFAKLFEEQFTSLLCSHLREEGFHPDNPPHLCEPLTCRAVKFSVDYLISTQIQPTSRNNDE